jgi:glutamyl-tRNA reductase
MSIRIIGVSHKTAPIDVREQLAVDAEQLPRTLHGLAEDTGVAEVLILSTCNRTELYCNIEPGADADPLLWLANRNGMDPAVLASHLYTLDEEQAVRHALRVACGLDSMVLGEPQILGQLKQAYQAAVGQGTAGKILNRLFQHSFYVAKQIRTQTAIGENSVSVAFTAVKLGIQIHGDLSDKTALLVGAGDTITLVAHHLRTNNIAELIIANRSVERSEELANRLNGRAVTLNELPANLAHADIVISSTASRLPLITEGAVRTALKARNGAPMFIVDLAVPRDVEPGVADVNDVYLYTVDDLNQVVGENTRLREAAAADAEEMINIQAQSYMDWLQSQDSTQTIVAIRARADKLKEEQLNKASRRLAAGDDPADVLSALANGLVNRLLHKPTLKIREAAMDGNNEVVRIARDILDPPD